MHLPKTREDLAKWKALGNYEEKLLDVYKKYTDEWAKAFPKQEISLHVSKVLDLPPEFCERVIDYGLSKYPAAVHDSKLPADRPPGRHRHDDL